MSKSNSTGGKVKIIALTATFFFGCSIGGAAQDSAKYSPMHIGFTYPLSTNGHLAHEYANDVSFHFLVGVSKEERKLAAAGLANITLGKATGAQLAGVANYTGGAVSGAQVAGIANIGQRQASGVQVAGFVNLSGSASGAQAAGFVNLTLKDVEGIQAAGFVNVAGSDVQGSQLAGFVNVAGDSVQGLQLAGIVNAAAKHVNGGQGAGFVNLAGRGVSGVQAAGFVNAAGGDVQGSQLAGIVNIAKGKVGGVQVAGFVNISDSCAYPIGIVNLVRAGEKSIGLSVDETLTSLVTFRSGGKYTYGVVGAGYNFRYKKEAWAYMLGLGAHLVDKKRFRLNVELTGLSLERFKSLREKHFFKSSVNLFPVLKASKHVELMAGVSLNYAGTNTDEGRALIPYAIWSHEGTKFFHAGYVGCAVGVNFRW
jgi:hypothetical protein